jgi:hypothetical protein
MIAAHRIESEADSAALRAHCWLGVSWICVRSGWASDHLATSIGAAAFAGVMGAFRRAALGTAIHRRNRQRMMRATISLARLGCLSLRYAHVV